jgi:predicted TIM-barrel fold metal-dependent hydrolase
MPLSAIDAHVHIHDAKARALQGDEASRRISETVPYFARADKAVPLAQQADEYRRRNMKAVLMNTSDHTVTGIRPIPNDFVAQAVRDFPDVFLGFGIVDPWQGELARREIARCKELGLAGIGEFNPSRQHFYPNDHRFYPLWEEAAKHGLVVLFHTGYSGVGSGTPGGRGVKLKYAQPIHLDDVAADFPDLTIIGAHPSWPWVSESLAIARHKANFYVDLSGFAPKYFPAELVQHMNSLLQDKTLFGSDAPSMPLERWLREFEALELKPEVRRKVLLENAARVFGLDPNASG